MVEKHPRQPDQPISRRSAMARAAVGLAGLSAASLLSACTSQGGRTASLPEPVWPSTARPPVRPAPTRPTYTRPAPTTDSPSGVIARSAWSGGGPVPSLMDPMLPIRRITLHHDGMTAFTSTSYADAAQRIEAIRAAHRGHRWGDIGYHYVIDPAGRVWQGRPLSWQGAHVRDQNQGNIGVCVLGNYERQYPNREQIAAVERFVAELMHRHRVPVGRIYTHRELAATACPGRNLQPRLVAMRTSGGALSA